MDLDGLELITYYGELQNPLYYCKETGNMYRLQLGMGRGGKGLNLITCTGKNGYLVVRINGKLIPVHAVVACQYLNHKPNKYAAVIDHKDGNKLNNRVENLQITNQRHNIVKHFSDTKLHGLPTNTYFNKRSNCYYIQFRLLDGRRTICTYDCATKAIDARDRIMDALKDGNKTFNEIQHLR